jgi:hypothetical protein
MDKGGGVTVVTSFRDSALVGAKALKVGRSSVGSRPWIAFCRR